MVLVGLVKCSSMCYSTSAVTGLLLACCIQRDMQPLIALMQHDLAVFKI